MRNASAILDHLNALWLAPMLQYETCLRLEFAAVMNAKGSEKP
jgi:hypothetical protein